VPIAFKSGSLNLQEPSGSVQACNGIALPFTDGLTAGTITHVRSSPAHCVMTSSNPEQGVRALRLSAFLFVMATEEMLE